MPPTYDHLASRQLGLITRAQLRDLGWTDDQVDHAVRSGRLVGVRRGVFRVAGAEAAPVHPILAHILAWPRADLLAATRSAALVWGFKYIKLTGQPVLVTGKRVRIKGVIVRRCLTLASADRALAGPVPVTSPARTIFDLAAETHPKALGLCLDDARRRQLVHLAEVQDTADRVRRLSPNNRGLPIIDRVLADRAGQTSAGGSGGELDLWPLLQRAGAGVPAQQHEVWIDGERFLLDYALPHLKIAIEYDPFETHARTKELWLRHCRRRAALEADGWLYVMIFESMTADEVLDAVMGAISRRKCH